ncbi:tetratricopeptide repeat protein [Bdellovibrionota bacterium FG-1]
MTKRFRNTFFLSARRMAFLTLAVSLGGHAFAAETVRLETFKTHSRLDFRVDGNVPTEWKSTPQGFDLFLKGADLADLGIPLGEEGKWAKKLKTLNDSRLTNIEVAEVEGGVKVRGRWKYPTGPQAPAQPQMESFDYRDKESSDLVIDFWVKDGPTLAQLDARREAERQLEATRKREEMERARAVRRAARAKVRAQEEDPFLFCRTPLNEDGDVFLQFQPFHEKVDFSRWISSRAPDTNFAYYDPKGKSQEAQYVRLALRLYRQNNFGLVNRTLDFFEKDFPNSSFRSEMRFLRSNALFKLGMVDQAVRELKEILHEPKGSSVTLQSAMFIAGRELDVNNYLGALETFMWLSSHHAESRIAWVFHLGAAECARALKQTDRAVKEYEWVAEHAPDAASRAEGGLRAGDLFMERFQYDQGLATYAQGLRHFKAEAETFPAVFINRAEALYGLGQLDRASEAFRDFLTRFPAHPAGWRATYRLAETEGRKVGATRDSMAARKWYFDTVNHYPFSPGATIARLQLMTCGDHGGFSPDSARKFLSEEAENFNSSAEIVMDRYKDFRALAHVRTLMTLGLDDEAVATAIDELQRIPRPEARRWLGSLLAQNFRKTILALLQDEKKIEALTFYQDNEGSVPRTEIRVDPDYLLKLSQAASDLGLGKVAQDLNNDYEKTHKMLVGKNRILASATKPELEDLEDHLQASERGYAEAKAIWIESGLANRVFSSKTMKIEEVETKIRRLLGQVAPESEYSDEREIILGLLDERAGHYQSALQHAAQAQVLGAKSPRVEAWVAALESKVGDINAALEAFRTLEARLGEEGYQKKGISELLGVAPLPSRETVILSQCEILEKQGRWGEAAAEYSHAVEKGLGGAQAKYGYARALLRMGDVENRTKALSALELLTQEEKTAKGAPPALVQPQDGEGKPRPPGHEKEREKFWRRLASETLANEKTKDNAKEGIR